MASSSSSRGAPASRGGQRSSPSSRTPSPPRAKAKSKGGARPKAKTAAKPRGPTAAELRREASGHHLEQILDMELDEVRKLQHPPKALRRLMEVLHLMLEGKASVPAVVDWQAVQVTLEQEVFNHRIRTCDVESLGRHPDVASKILNEYFSGPDALTFESIQHASRGALALFGWASSLVAHIVSEHEKHAVEAEAKAKAEAHAEHAGAKKGRSPAKPQKGKGKGKTPEQIHEYEIMSEVHKLIAAKDASNTTKPKGAGKKGSAQSRGHSKEAKIPAHIENLSKAFLAAKKCRAAAAGVLEVEKAAAKARETALSKPAPILLKIQLEGEAWKKELSMGHSTQAEFEKCLRNADLEVQQAASPFTTSAKKLLDESRARVAKPEAPSAGYKSGLLEWPNARKQIGFEPMGLLPSYTAQHRFQKGSHLALGILTASCGPDAKVKDEVTGQVPWPRSTVAGC